MVFLIKKIWICAICISYWTINLKKVEAIIQGWRYWNNSFQVFFQLAHMSSHATHYLWKEWWAEVPLKIFFIKLDTFNRYFKMFPCNVLKFYALKVQTLTKSPISVAFSSAFLWTLLEVKMHQVIGCLKPISQWFAKRFWNTFHTVQLAPFPRLGRRWLQKSSLFHAPSASATQQSRENVWKIGKLRRQKSRFDVLGWFAWQIEEFKKGKSRFGKWSPASVAVMLKCFISSS